MKRIQIVFILIILLISSTKSLAQTEVKIDGKVTNDEYRAQKILEEYTKLSNELSATISSLNKKSASVSQLETRLDWNKASSNEYEELINKTEALKSDILGAHLETKISKLIDLQKKRNSLLNQPNSSIYNPWASEASFLTTKTQERLNRVYKKWKNTNQKQNKKKSLEKDLLELDSEISDLDNELASRKRKSEEQEKQLNKLTKKEIKNIDDFLAKSVKSKTNDFLSEENSSVVTDDFLSSSNNNEDFLSEKNETITSFKIKTKGGDSKGPYLRIQGVVDNNNNILIPFKKWDVKEYKNGIAKVGILLEYYNDNYGAIRVAYVDSNGEILDSFVDFDTIGHNWYTGGIVIDAWDPNTSLAERERIKKKRKLERELAYQREQEKRNNWKKKMLIKYN